MTSREVVQLIEQIDAAYPGKIKKSQDTVKVWFRHMKNQDVDRVVWRLDNHISRSPFPPTIHDLKEQIRPEHDKGVVTRINDWQKKKTTGPTDEQRKKIYEFLDFKKGD
ncbi:hypothetical protein [Salipaludibacillus sp. CF4.18]|uniref:hypothetical protein n=1 Tax=Salipaludibacillus sp. CF4.18 TaxID=3373081 RepID=UPI003EE59337